MQIRNLNITIPGYKLSYYNFFQTYDSGDSVVFNSLYRCLLAFNKEETNSLCAGQIPSACNEELINNHILIPEDADELQSYADVYHNVNTHSEVLSISVIPTLACNMACPYCFEKKSKIKITAQTEIEILNWIEKQLPQYKALSLSWFGGEGLLCQDVIRRMTIRLIAKCEELGIFYTAAITTNGLLMDNRETIELLQQCAIRNVQITFDGNQATHDAQKFTKGGQGTYVQLLKNASLYCASNPNTPLRIRVNVSDANYHNISDLLDDLSPIKNNVVIFFRWVYANSASHWKEFSQKEKGSNPYERIYQLQQLATHKGFVVDDQYDKQQFRFAHCEADSQGFYSIDPLGNIYTCVHEYNPKYAVGNVREGIFPEKATEYMTFRNVDVLQDAECRKCKILPMCNGGCRRYRINHGTHLCVDEKQSMHLYIDMLRTKLSNIS